MVSTIDAGIDRVAPLPLSGPGVQPEHEEGNGGNFRLFGEDGFTFRDFIDLINPLQHIPVVSTVYRAVTGDHIDPGSKIIGSTILGGPVGAALSITDVAIKHNTGRDVGEHVAAIFTGPAEAPAEDPVQVALQPDAAEKHAAAWTPPAPAFSPSGKGAGLKPGESYAFADRAAAYMPRTLPDLGLLAEVKPRIPAAADPAKPAEAAPRALEPLYELNDAQEAAAATPVNGAAAVERELNAARNGWIYEKMLEGLEQYDRTNRWGSDPSGPGETASVTL